MIPREWGWILGIGLSGITGAMVAWCAGLSVLGVKKSMTPPNLRRDATLSVWAILSLVWCSHAVLVLTVVAGSVLYQAVHGTPEAVGVLPAVGWVLVMACRQWRAAWRAF